ncbi:MAG: helix-turn-helix domain-containing protein [Pigmentiphaga sp.]
MIVTAPPPELPTLFSEPEFAKYLGVSIDTVRRERWRGNLGHLRIGSRVFYTAEHALDYFNRHQVPPCSKEAPNTPDKSGTTGSRRGQTVRPGAEPGSTPTPDRRAAHLLAQRTFQMPSSDLPNG